MGFNLDDYEPVEERLAKFWADHPTGRVLTDLLSHGDGHYIVKALAWKDATTERPDASGLAEETVATSGVNKTSALENCETSAIGRALANLGYAAKGRRASREEMSKAQPQVEPHIAEMMTYVASLTQGDVDAARGYVTETMRTLGLSNPLTVDDCQKIKETLAEKLADGAPF